MPSIRLMGFAAGALFLLSSTGNAQSVQAPAKAMPTVQAPAKAMPTAQAPSKVLPQPQAPGKGMPAAYGSAGYYGGGYSGGTAGYPGGYDFGRPGYNPGGLGGPASGIGVRPGLGPAGSARGADRPEVLRLLCAGARPGPTGSLGAVVAAANSWLPWPASEETRTSTSAAGRHPRDDPAR